MTEGFIPPHGGYKNLLSYRKAEIVYDATISFCERFVDKRSRTHDLIITYYNAYAAGNMDAWGERLNRWDKTAKYTIRLSIV